MLLNEYRNEDLRVRNRELISTLNQVDDHSLDI